VIKSPDNIDQRVCRRTERDKATRYALPSGSSSKDV
jgi:hypothetical protein